MSGAEWAAVGTAIAALGATLAQWLRLFGPRRNGGVAVIRYLERRIAETEEALADCLQWRGQAGATHRTQPGRWSRQRPRKERTL